MRASIFDVDGTLVDRERDGHRVAFNRAFEELDLPDQQAMADADLVLDGFGDVGARAGRRGLPGRLLAPAGMRGTEGITGPAALAKFSWLTRPAIWVATSRKTPPTVLSGAAAING